MIIPTSVVEVGTAFVNCNLDYMLLLGQLSDYKNICQSLACKTVYTWDSLVSQVKNYYEGDVVGLGTMCNLDSIAIAPTSAVGKISLTNIEDVDLRNYVNGDFYVFENDTIIGHDVSLFALDPDTTYNFTYCMTSGDNVFTAATLSFTTPVLELITLDPQPVSETCAIVAASTNISADETNVGFQWKKYDAPESLKPNEGYAAIHDGRLKGYIKKLQSSSYYNVRAFYKSATGNYYYGDWVTFDPSDFSYFEPTVHTYPAEEVTCSSVKIRGYVLAGTEEVVEQGFQYWIMEEDESKAKYAYAHDVEQDVTTVFATGQVMSVVLDNLQPNTTYCFRAFVKTANGMTYGEEQTFTTGFDATGIDVVETDNEKAEVIGYYNLGGRRIPELQRGFNIIRYGNGTSKKVYVK